MAKARRRGRWAAVRRLLLGSIATSALAALILTHAPGPTRPNLVRHRERKANAPAKQSHRPPLPLTRYDDYFLAHTSMWAMGANARTIPPRRANVPLVTWTKGAASRVERAWRSIQDSVSCDRALYAYTPYWGLTSQMRDYGDSAIVSLAFRRPLNYIPHAMRPKWCPADAWLGCFFQGPFDDRSKQRCSKNDLEEVFTFRPNTSTRAQRRTTHARFADLQPVVLDYLAELNFVLDDPLFFPMWLWEDLIRNRLVRIVDKRNAELDPSWLKTHDRSLYHTLAVSALRTMLAPILFRPHQHIQRKVELRRQEINLHAAEDHCVTLHLRWTDKATDGGVASVSGYAVEHVSHALKLIRQKIGLSSRACVLVLTDDDVKAMPALVSALSREWPEIKLQLLSRVSRLFGPLDDYELYSQVGHRYVSDVMATQSPVKAAEYFSGLVVDILTASNLSNALIGMGCSGVSQLVSQYMGAARRLDANALAIWQEDAEDVLWRSIKDAQRVW